MQYIKFELNNCSTEKLHLKRQIIGLQQFYFNTDIQRYFCKDEMAKFYFREMKNWF